MNEPVESHWGTRAVDLSERALPSLKAKFLVDHAPRSGKLVEIGSGDGKLLRTLRQHLPALELHGCDVRNVITAPDVYEFRRIVGDSGRLPYDDGTFEAVAIFDVLEHVPDPERTLDEIRRILKPGGKMIAFIPVEGEPISFYTLYKAILGKETFAETKEHIQAFTHEGLRAALDRRFTVAGEPAYAYHPLGQFMDASFFAATKLERLRRFWWKENTYYNDAPTDPRESSTGAGVMNGLLRVANRTAFLESTLLRSVRAGSAGLLYAGVRS